MFGVLQGCRCHLDAEGHKEWRAHICGVCAALGRTFGRLWRVALNYDSALLSVLTEAQGPERFPRVRYRCPLPPFRQLEVVDPELPAVRFAACVSVLGAATRIRDHVLDGDTWLRHLPGVFLGLARKGMNTARPAAEALGFSTAAIEGEAERQLQVERRPGLEFAAYCDPVERAVGASVMHTAALAGCPHNADPLYELGRAFGRIMYLLDGYKDYAADLASRSFNPLSQSPEGGSVTERARELFARAQQMVRDQFDRLALHRLSPARPLVFNQLEAIGHRALAEAPEDPVPGRSLLCGGHRRRPESQSRCACCCDTCECCGECGDAGGDASSCGDCCCCDKCGDCDCNCD